MSKSEKQYSNNPNFEYHINDLDAMSVAINYNNWILDKIGKYLGQSILECGAGSGTFAKSLLNRFDTNFVALEPSQNAFSQLKTNLADFRKVELIPSFFDQVATKLQNKIDTIIYNNVLEHIEDDYLEINLAYKTLQKGGHIVTFSPALPILYSDYDNSIGHFRRYTLKNMSDKINNAGFNVVEAYYFDFFGFFLWYLKYKVLRNTSLSSGSLSIYDKLVIPILRKIEPSKIIPFGKNVVVIGKK